MNYTKKLYIVFHQGFDKHNAQLYWALYSALDCTRALESFSCFPFFASSLRVSMFCITLPHTFCRFLSSAHLFFRVVVLYSLLLRRFFAVHFFVSAGFSLRPCWYLLLLFTSVHTHTHTLVVFARSTPYMSRDSSVSVFTILMSKRERTNRVRRSDCLSQWWHNEKCPEM